MSNPLAVFALDLKYAYEGKHPIPNSDIKTRK
jgi:hypothetical protein